MVFEQTEFSLYEMLHGLISLHKPAALAKNIDLVLSYKDVVPHSFIGDEGRLRQVINNLIGNAVKFTPSGDVSVYTHGYHVDRQNFELTVYVRDTGMGIAPHDQQRVFKRFEQVNNGHDKSVQGTGLGLTISKDIIHAMGGKMDLVSYEGHGTTFYFKVNLPVAREYNLTSDASSDMPLRSFG